MPWTFEFALPNLVLEKPIETKYMALVRHDDPRIIELREKHQLINAFLSRFRTAEGMVVNPTVLLIRTRIPRTMRTAEALGGFRDAIALSVIPYARVSRLLYHSGHHDVPYSNTFELYPWRINLKQKLMYLSTPAHGAGHFVSAFHGQSFPEVPVTELYDHDIDWPLLNRLLVEWVQGFKTKTPPPHSLNLFRSLNVANHASRIPATNPVTVYDAGRLIALWTSAFDFLIHPGGTKSVFKTDVYDLLDKVEWQTSFCKRAVHRLPEQMDKQKFPKPKRRRPACWLYGLIYQFRNRFVHGNPTSQKDLHAPGVKRGIWMQAAPLYRCALTAYLGMTAPKFNATTATKEESEAYRVYGHFQGHMELAIRTAKPNSISFGRRLTNAFDEEVRPRRKRKPSPPPATPAPSP